MGAVSFKREPSRLLPTMWGYSEKIAVCSPHQNPAALVPWLQNFENGIPAVDKPVQP